MEKKIKDKLKHPYELFGVECGKGWYDLLKPIVEYIEKYNEDKEEEQKIRFTQIKEKWGGLRVYVNFGTDELFKLIEQAEDESYNICEDCGTRTDVGLKETGWIRTLCKECAIKEAKYYNGVFWKSNDDGKTYYIDSNGYVTEDNEFVEY
jgi:hypothetical protein